MITKYTRELVVGDVIRHIDGSVAEIKFIQPFKEDTRLFAITYFNRNTQTDEFDYQHGGVQCEMVVA